MLRSPYELNLWNLANDVHLALGEKHANGALKRRAPGSSAVLGQRGENRHYRLSLSPELANRYSAQILTPRLCVRCVARASARERESVPCPVQLGGDAPLKKWSALRVRARVR